MRGCQRSGVAVVLPLQQPASSGSAVSERRCDVGSKLVVVEVPEDPASPAAGSGGT